jgi:ABC-type multidrug transport system fused ATPase/permease subunit
MNKKIAASVILIAIIVASVASWFVNNQISELQSQNSKVQDQLSESKNQLNELQLQNREQQDFLNDFTYELAKARHLRVEITAFQWISSFDPIGGLWLGHPVNVTVENSDVVPLMGLRLRVTLANENTGAKIGASGSGITIDGLDAGERQSFYVDGMEGPWTSLNSSLEDAVCVVTLTVGDIVLERGTFSIS